MLRGSRFHAGQHLSKPTRNAVPSVNTLQTIVRMLYIRRHDSPAERALSAIALVFLINGTLLASWISRIPAITDRHGLSTGQVGTMLMALAVGAIVSFAIAGIGINRNGSAKTTLVFGSLFALMLPLVGLSPSIWMLVPVFVLFGAGNGGMDVAMNSQGVEVEQTLGRSIINSLHGFFSLGGVVGAALGALAAGLGVSPAVHLPIVGAVALTGLWWLHSNLIPDTHMEPGAHDEPVFALPPKAMWALGVIAFCSAIGEGAMADWSALYLDDELDTGGAIAALGFAAFSLAMLIGRFSGDRLVDRYGSPLMVRVGATISSVGLAIGLLINTPVAVIISFAFVGLGLSVLFPLVFKAAASFPGVSRGRAVAGVATIGYTGFLVGPPVLGWIAEPTSLRVSMVIVAILCGAVILLAPSMRQQRPVGSTRQHPVSAD
jgi:MFS family permease